MSRIAQTTITALLTLVCAAATTAAQWPHPLSLDGGGWWRGRVAVVIQNDRDAAADGEPVAVRIGAAPGEAALVGQSARAIRVANQAGVEMVYALVAPDGTPLIDGPIPAGSTLVLPLESAPHAAATYYVYFDNPAAGQVPDYLTVHLGLVNGDLEQGSGPAPTGWAHDNSDDAHQATWSEEQPQSGKKCLKTVVREGAEPTWIATRQNDLQIIGGAKYVMRAWVKAENVKGFAGWYIHVGNRQEPMLISPMLNAGQGAYGWKEVTAEFTAPADADRADLGTVLRGTGTAWFDHVTLQCLDEGNRRLEVQPPERRDLQVLGGDATWYEEPNQNGLAWEHRALVRVFNFSAEPLARPLVFVDGAMLDGRLRGRLNRQSIAVTHAGKRVPHFLDGNLLLFEGGAPAGSVADYYVYFSDDPRIKLPAASQYASLAASDRNLVKNPSYEEDGEVPVGWTSSGPKQGPDGVSFSLDASAAPGLGQRSVKMQVPHACPKSWRGWHQSVKVQPGHTYLLAAWVKCQDVQGQARLHAHCHTAEGQLTKDNPMTSVGPDITGSTDWTLLCGRLTMPADAAELRLHLTMDATGTLWHDGVLVAECLPGSVSQLEGRPMNPGDPLRVWPVNAVVKVFPDEPAPRIVPPAEISCARNEKEPLQLAIRSPNALRGVQVQAEPPVGPNGARLNDLQVNVVGYVPIDHPTSYYQSTTPAWHRKVPSQSGMCDGWPGMWPDPLLPRDTLDLAANQTQAVWITLGAGVDAPAGDYAGKVRLVCQGKPVAEAPYKVRVWGFVLPKESHVKAIYDVGPTKPEQFWGQPIETLYPEIVRFMASRRLCPNTIRPTPKFQYKDGKASADFSAYDKVAAWYFDELKLPHAYTPWDFYLFGWGFPPKSMYGEQPYPGPSPFEGADRSQLRPEYKKAFQACLRLFWDHLKEKGWDKKVVLYISDEPFYSQEPIRKQMKALCAMIHEVSPEIPIYSSTWHHVPDWDGSLDIWGIGHYGVVPVDKMAQLKAAGARIWFTTDGQMCTDTPYCAVERLLPHYCFKYGADAYEFWGIAWLTYDPYRYGWHAYIHQSDQPGKSYWVRYPNGDGFLLYPGKPIGHGGLVSSIRLEQAREGVEDYEYLYLLRGLIAQAKAAGRDAAGAEKALEQAAALVTIPNAGGRYSSKILPDPAALYTARQALAAAIERLTEGGKK
jgi:hypothetical protein